METLEIQKRVCNEIEKMNEEIVQTVQSLVRIPSVVGSEGQAQEFMEERYRSMAPLEVICFQPEIDRVKDHPAFIDTGMSYEGRRNVIGLLPGNKTSPSLILNGHVDVVSPEPVRSWSHDPWGAETVGDRIYGRGTGDMKAGLLANFFALKGILKAGLRPKGTVILQSVIDEEAGGAGGTLASLMGGYTADGMICTEPHNLQVTIAHAGINYFRVRVFGKTSHAGLAHLGVNAIGKMYLIYQALIDLDEKRGREIHFPLFEKGSGRSCHINVGTMKAGDWPSNVAGSAEIECRIGFVPGEKAEEIKQMIERTIHEAVQKDPWLREHPPEIEWFGWHADPWYQDPNHPFVQSFKRAAEKVLGRDVDLIGRASGIDSRFSQYFNMAAACTGPRASNIHGIDEYVEIPSIFQVTQVLAMATLQWCGYET
jgi:acetylornithine deacetylase